MQVFDVFSYSLWTGFFLQVRPPSATENLRVSDQKNFGPKPKLAELTIFLNYLQVLNLLCTFNWNFADLFLMVIGYALTQFYVNIRTKVKLLADRNNLHVCKTKRALVRSMHTMQWSLRFEWYHLHIICYARVKAPNQSLLSFYFLGSSRNLLVRCPYWLYESCKAYAAN